MAGASERAYRKRFGKALARRYTNTLGKYYDPGGVWLNVAKQILYHI